MMQDLQDIPPGRLWTLLAPPEDWPSWSEREHRMVLEHQLEAELLFDLERLDPGSAAAAADASRDSAIRTFADLLAHPDPPVHLLELVKHFAKRNIDSGEALPTPVATVLYYAVIAAGRLHGGHRISSLNDAELRRGFDWALSQEWVDAPVRPLLEAGREGVG